MPTSFRKDLRLIPCRYRTPSPPRDGIEPLSPCLHENATADSFGLEYTHARDVRNELKRPNPTYYDGCNGSRQSRKLSGGEMDAFTSIALATESSDRINVSTSGQSINLYDDRPTKRSRSEKLPSPQITRKSWDSESRPATSYEHPPEDRREEAELLLNFAQANFAQALNPYASPSPDTSRRKSIKPYVDSVVADGTMTENEGYMHPDDGQDQIRRPNDGGKPDVIDTQGTPIVKDILHGEHDAKEPYAEQNLEDGGPIESKVLEEAQLIIRTDRTERADTTPGISEHDIVELIPEPTNSVQSIGEGRTISDQREDRGILELVASSVASKPLSDELTHMAVIDASPSKYGEEGDARLKGEPIDQPNVHELRSLPHEDVGNESFMPEPPPNSIEEDTRFSRSEVEIHSESKSDSGTPNVRSLPTVSTAVCAACKFTRNSKGVDPENDSLSWISCDACKSWFHFACAGFKSEREVRGVDKYRCRKCKPVHGSTTYVRKSSRAHSAIDYAGLHQGVIKTSDERPEHHYIKPIKEGTITFLPETFARMRPELVTAEFFEKGTGMKEPIVIPACFNTPLDDPAKPSLNENTCPPGFEGGGTTEDWLSCYPEQEVVPDHGQDALDMVIPRGLTVRQVAELYGPEEKVEVIDVKSQNGENKKWNMRRWVDYYENPNNKVVRNVISLEVSQSKLGRLIRRPQIVRDLDLQDSVWPEDLLAKGEYPRVQFYCLMSVADCFTDFHIDFGGSSVFYHILKGKKTFLFIPPKEKHLKKYEEWCMSPAQNWTFLGDQTKECYRVDLWEGDTMLIPSGWIHAVWTPEDSLVIGGNFLTRMNFGMQLRVAQVEKATGVARKFRYPHFQKLLWYTALRYLETDPLPQNVRDLLHAGGSFSRATPTYYDFDAWGENSRAGLENYHARYYSQSELDGLPDLTRYLLRTALIDIGSITDGISADTRNAVKKSIPRGHGEPLDLMKTFAAWCAWKRGNEPIPHWAYPDAVPENLAPDKLSAAATKKLDREAALSAPRRQSARMQSQQEDSAKPSPDAPVLSTPNDTSDLGAVKRAYSDLISLGQNDSPDIDSPKRPRTVSTAISGSHRKTACESCRKRRRACKHKDQVAASAATAAIGVSGMESLNVRLSSSNPTISPSVSAQHVGYPSNLEIGALSEASGLATSGYSAKPHLNVHEPLQTSESSGTKLSTSSQATAPSLSEVGTPLPGDTVSGFDIISGMSVAPRPRTKACNDCRKSKRRCIHDPFGNEDPVKVRESAIPRPHARKSHLQGKDGLTKKPTTPKSRVARPNNPPPFENTPRSIAPIANMVAQQPASEAQVDGSPAGLDAATQRDIAERASLLLDPALFLDGTEPTMHQQEASGHIPVAVPSGTIDPPNASIKEDVSKSINERQTPDTSDALPKSRSEPTAFESKESFEQPASSLVSPPPSSHDDVGNSPTAADPESITSRSSSEQLVNQTKNMQQRFTPESGPMRRASSSSHGEVAPDLVKPASDPLAVKELQNGYKTDEESLKLIKELQAQELGLRRRGKV